jgi:2-hydroxychromene-2-carboxylate isomerase
MSASIEFYFDFISPYGYFASEKIGGVASHFDRSVDWKPVLLGITVLKVMGLKPLMETPLKSDYIRHDKQRMAKLLNVPFHEHNIKGVNSLNALRAFLWLKAKDPELAIRFAQRIYQRLWVKGLDITEPEAAAAEAEVLGVDSHALLQGIGCPATKETLKSAVQDAIDRGVFGTPYFIVDGEPIWGVDRLWMLEHWLQHHNWKPPTSD